MSDETTREFLDRREKQLQQQIAAFETQILLRRQELAEVASLKEKLRTADAKTESEIFAYATAQDTPLKLPKTNSNALLTGDSGLPFSQVTDSGPVYHRMTIKQLIVQALIDNFPKGATAAELRDFIKGAYGRTIDPSSMRPQLRRLKQDEILGHDPSGDVWNFRDGIRKRYSFYNHPASRQMYTELREDEPNE